MMNIPVNWKVFDSKFSPDPRGAFESLAHTLFCYEMNQPHGVFRYFNQPYIETQPVTAVDGTLTGYQAKYYDSSTAFSSKEGELKDAIKGAAIKYPGIGRILLYVNKELSASPDKGKVKPNYQINIEQCGEDLGIEIIWRVLGNMEQMLLALPTVRDLYFNPQPGLSRFMELVHSRKDSILNSIQSDISYQNQTIKIQRDAQTLWNTEKPVCILYGDAGTGKSGAMKDLLRERDSSLDPLVFNASDLDVEEEVLFLHKYGGYQLEDVFSLYGEDEQRVCVIDSAEKVYTQRHPQVFQILIRKLIDHGWKLIFTIRTAYKNSFCATFLDGVSCEELQINQISESTLAQMGEQYGFCLPEDNKLRNLLCNLFYLKLYLKLAPASPGGPVSSELFIRKIWDEVICGFPSRAGNLPIRREHLAIHIVISMLQNDTGIYESDVNDDYEALEALEASGVIASYDGSGCRWMMSHDVYEELIVKHILTDKYQKHVPIKDFQTEFGTSLRARKLYRVWLKALVLQDGKRTAGFFVSVMDGPWDQTWKDETLIALMQSENADIPYILESLIGREQYKLFSRTAFLLDTACRGVNQELLRELPELGTSKYLFAQPEGSAWLTMFRYIYENRTLIPWKGQNLEVVITILKSWTSAHKIGETTRLAGKIALWLKDKLWNDTEFSYRLRRDSRLIALTDVILKSALELKPELGKRFAAMFSDEIPVDNLEDHEDFLLLKKSLSNIFDCGTAYQALPLEVLHLAKRYWFGGQRNMREIYDGFISMEGYFGLSRSIQGEYDPASAYQTPLFPLLRVKPAETLKFIIQLMNDATDNYKTSRLEAEYHEVSEIELRFPDGTIVRQSCSDRLWKLYRGTSVAPELLESALMALERWLLDVVEQVSDNTAVKYCEYLLRNSRTAAITAVILSIVEAYPDKLFEISCILLKTKEIFILDISRMSAESSANFSAGLLWNHELYADERIKSNQLPSRKVQFEKVLIDYQLNSGKLGDETYQKRLAKLYAALDEATTDMASWEKQYQYAYYRIDLRKCRATDIQVEQGTVKITVGAHLPEELEKNRKETNERTQRFWKHMPLHLWADARLEHRSEEAHKYPQFEDGPTPVIEEIKQVFQEDDPGFLDISAAINACCVLLSDEKEMMTEDQTVLCEETVLSCCARFLDGKERYQAGDGTVATIPALVRLAAQGGNSVEWSEALLLLLALAMDGNKEHEIAVESISNILWKLNAGAARKLVRAYTALAPRYAREVWYTRTCSAVQFFEKNSEEIDRIFQEELPDLHTVSLDGLEIVQLIDVQKMIDPRDPAVFDLVLKIGDCVWETILGNNPKDSRKQRYYGEEQAYLRWLSDYILNLSEEQQGILLERMMQAVKYDRSFCSFLEYIIIAEDITPRYAAFWSLWQLMKPYIFAACEKKKEQSSNSGAELSVEHGLGVVLAEYLLAGNFWNKGVKSWHSLQGENADFYLLASNQVGYHGVTLYAVSRVLNTIGFNAFFDDGIEWLSSIVRDNPHLRNVSLPVNTRYYLEVYMNRYVRKYIFTLPSNPQCKHMVLDVLDFLVEKGSATGFLLREEIL